MAPDTPGGRTPANTRMYTRPRRPPATGSQLLSYVSRYARHRGVPQDRMQRWVAFMVLAGALDRHRTGIGEPLFVIKGGVTMELRLGGQRARATKDFDAVFRHETEDLVAEFDAALRQPYGDFSFERRGEAVDRGRVQQLWVTVMYRYKSWARIKVELSLPESGPPEHEPVEAISLAAFGLEGPEMVPCLALRYQIAQKLHAVTQILDGRDNLRFWDLIDLLLLRDLVADLSAVREAAERVFRHRARQPWPPELTVPSSWVGPYAKLAADIGFPIADIHQAADEVRAFIRTIAVA